MVAFIRGLILFVIAAAAPPTGADSANDEVILILGDSLSAAHGMALSAGWPSLLQQRLDAAGRQARVVNASISGETSSGGRSRLTKLIAEHHPSIVILELGANDALRGLPIPVVRDNLSAMVDESLAAGADVLLLGITVPINYGPTYRDQFAAVFEDLATEHDLAWHPFFLDGVATDPLLMQSDGLHPTAEAQPKVLDNVWPLLEPLLESAATMP